MAFAPLSRQWTAVTVVPAFDWPRRTMDSNTLLHHHHAQHHFTERCACGREFYTPGAVSNHKRTCKKAKTRRFGALEKAKEVFRSAKKFKQSAESPTDERFVTPSSRVSVNETGSNMVAAGLLGVSSVVCDLTFTTIMSLSNNFLYFVSLSQLNTIYYQA